MLPWTKASSSSLTAPRGETTLTLPSCVRSTCILVLVPDQSAAAGLLPVADQIHLPHAARLRGGEGGGHVPPQGPRRLSRRRQPATNLQRSSLGGALGQQARHRVHQFAGDHPAEGRVQSS